MSLRRGPCNSLAFGVEPGHRPYRLQQARYQALAEDVARLAQQRLRAGEPPLKLVDVGVCEGVSRRYIEAHAGTYHIEWHGVDVFPYGQEAVYRHADWSLYEIDLERGMPQLPSDHFDVVLCEQVLEHLHAAPHAAAELVRILRPQGLLIVGVPIFPLGLHHVRRDLVPLVDRLLGSKKVRGHVQAFSLASFRRLLEASGPIQIKQSRGFRVVSGGLLEPLEDYRWWWQLNRRIGQLVPSLCIETQVLATKTQPSAASLPLAGRQAA
jgi:SAM-dependent methyltransferase